MANEKMRELFLSGKTTDRTYRGETLGKLYADVRAKKNDIVGCLAGDLGRPAKECALIYSSMIEKPVRIAAKKDWTKWRWLAPVLPDVITTGRLYRKPLGLVLIEADPREPFLFVFPRFLASLMAGNPTVLSFSGRQTRTGSLLTELANAAIPNDFGTIVLQGREIPAEEMDYVFAEEYPGRVCAVFDGTADYDKGAEKLVYAWRRMEGLNGVKPEVIYCPASMRSALVKQIDKWARRSPDDPDGRKVPVIGVRVDDELAEKLEAEGEMFALYMFSNEDTYALRIALDRPYKYAGVNSVTLRAPSMRAYFNESVTSKTIMMR
jgi:acyl-CoA reductase-like NAD-dependent aldehyde dehydrogenase